MTHLRLFEVLYDFTRKPYRIIVEATDYGDAESRCALFDARKPERITEQRDVMLVTHPDYLSAQDRAYFKDVALQVDEGKAF